MSYDSEVLADTPLGFWKLQDTSGTTATDSSGNARNGTISGVANTDYKLNQAGLLASEPASPSFLFAYGSGSDQGGWRDNATGGSQMGSKAYISVPYGSWMNFTGSWACEFWIKFYLNNINNCTIIGRRLTVLQWQLATNQGFISTTIWHASAGSGDYYPGFGTTAEFKLKSRNFPNSLVQEISDSIVSTLDLFDGNPHHVVAQNNVTTGLLEIYVDGVRGHQAQILPDNAQSSTSDPFIIGSYTNGGANGVVGYMQKVALYSAPLSVNRIQAHYFAGTGKIAALHLGWALDAYVGGAPAANVLNVSDVAQYSYFAGMSQQNEVSMSDSASGFIALGSAITDGFSATDTPSGAAAFGPTVTEALTATDTDSGIKQIAEVLVEGFLATDTQAAGTVLIGTVTDGATLYCGLQHGGETYAGYVLNADNNASSFYEGFDFNSLAKIGPDYYGANPSGVFKLEGSTDAGAQIDAMVNVGTSDAMTARKKSYDSIYLGLTAGGKMVLKVIVDGTEYFYEATDSATSMKEVRVVPGKGLQATFWQFELRNQGGADFDVASVEFHPVILTRRI